MIVSKSWLVQRLFHTGATVFIGIAKLRETLRVIITVITQQFISFAYDSFCTEIGAATPLMDLTVEIMPRIVYPCPQYRLANAVLIGLTLRVALKDVITDTIDAASR